MLEALKHLASTSAASASKSAEQTELLNRFNDIQPPLNARQAALESARCLYCYDAPCTRICPTEIDVPSFIQNIASGNLQGAATGILQQNILGASCSRVCPTEILCEHACVRNHDSEAAPVRIGLLQRYALDHAGFTSHPFQRAPATGKTIAIVGAGPAGLACAHQLAMHGHEVVIYESQAKAGGLNEYGIARYKLVQDTAQREIEFLLGIGGIRILCNQTLGQQIHLSDLRRDYDAVFLAIGLGASRRLGLAEEDAPGMLPAVDYIAELRQSQDLLGLALPAQCVVIGAGNTAIDMAVQIARLGAEQVTLVYRRGAQQMSATAHEQSIARDHQVRIMTWHQPQQVLLNAQGQVAGLRVVQTREHAGRLIADGAVTDIPAQAIFKAIGQTLDTQTFSAGDASDIRIEHDKIRVDADYRTSLDGVYAGGDCIAVGLDLTVQAVQHGKLAALAIHSDLNAKV